MSGRGWAMRRLARAAGGRGYCTKAYNYTEASLAQAWQVEPLKYAPAGVAAPQSLVAGNGLRVITRDLGDATSSIAFYVDAGAVYETSGSSGVSDAVAEMLFKSNLVSSDYHMFKTFQHSAAEYHCSQVGKRWISMKLSCRRDLIAPMMQRMCEAMFVPRFAPHELPLVREKLENKAVTRDHDPASFVTEQAVATAFSGSALGNSAITPEYNVDKLKADDLLNWWSQFFVPSRILLCGVNVSAEELQSAFDAAEWSGCANSAASHAGCELLAAPRQQGMYSGGQWRQYSRATEQFKSQRWYDDAHVVYARRGFGRGITKDYAASLVAGALVGPPPNGACGTGGIVQAFDGAGIIGGMVRARPADAGAAVKALAAAVNGVGQASADALAVAKKTAAVAFLSSVESRDALLDFFAMHSSAGGLTVTPEDVAESIGAVTAADMKRVADHMQAAPPTLAAFGDLATVPALQAL